MIPVKNVATLPRDPQNRTVFTIPAKADEPNGDQSRCGGDTNVGKTAITGSLTDDAMSTLGASSSTKAFQVDIRSVSLQI
jgi:hypothetical protein